MEEKNELSVQPRDYGAEILEIIHASLGEDELRAALLEYHENDIAGVFDELEAEGRERLYDILGSEIMSGIVTYLDDAGDYLSELDADDAADIIENMDADEAVEALEELDS